MGDMGNGSVSSRELHYFLNLTSDMGPPIMGPHQEPTFTSELEKKSSDKLSDWR